RLWGRPAGGRGRRSQDQRYRRGFLTLEAISGHFV
ncbi:hypothetical protein ATR1_121c0001, partial [Acetobacter tropicalis]